LVVISHFSLEQVPPWKIHGSMDFGCKLHLKKWNTSAWREFLDGRFMEEWILVVTCILKSGTPQLLC
jgi:hypothetical protein